jgi:hypothetical protein
MHFVALRKHGLWQAALVFIEVERLLGTQRNHDEAGAEEAAKAKQQRHGVRNLGEGESGGKQEYRLGLKTTHRHIMICKFVA